MVVSGVTPRVGEGFPATGCCSPPAAGMLGPSSIGGGAMRVKGKNYRTLWELPDAGGIEVIDQRHLPHRFATVALRTPGEVATAIREMWVRGAPLIGAAAGYGVYLAARRADDARVDAAVAEAAELLAATRPTAVDLRWA